MKKTKINYAVLVSLLLYKSGSFGASEATKKLIHETLAKYGISAGGKEICDTGRDTDYDKQTGIVKCKNTFDGDSNNCWDASSRLCKECPYTTVVSPRDHITCRQIICPEGFKLVKIKDGECPKGFKRQYIKNNSCGKGFNSYTEKEATNNYTTQLTHCKNVKINNN